LNSYLLLTVGKIGDADLQSLGEMPKLSDLRLGGTLVADKCLPIIKKQFPKGGYITAQDSKMTPAGVEPVKSSTSLSTSARSIEGSKVSRTWQCTSNTRIDIRPPDVRPTAAVSSM
jgi:hypothetical protein